VVRQPAPYLWRIAIILLIAGTAAGAGGGDPVTGQLETKGSGFRNSSNDLTDEADRVGIVRSSPRRRIDDNQSAVVTVAYSVAVDAPNYFHEPIDVSVVDGVASFAQPLPAVVGRGDRVEIEGIGTVFVDRCLDDTTCSLVDGRGLRPIEAHGVVAYSATAAFGSLAEAVEGAADADHLRTSDLVAINRALELVCYGDIEDTTPVVIDGWVTSAKNRIRIVAADPSYGHDRDFRHPGRWSEDAYRLDVWGGDCLRTTVGNLAIDGLQFLCAADAATPVNAINLDAIDGEIEISGALIHLAGTGATAERVAVRATSWGESEVVVRNSIMWGLGGSELHTGILVGNNRVELHAYNNTIVGGGYGIRNLGGAVTAINNLVAASGFASFDGDFKAASSRNLGADASTPNPPPNAVGPVTMVNPVYGIDADYHLLCGVMDQKVSIEHPFEIGYEESPKSVFDGDPSTLLRSDSINPAKVILEFAEERAATGTSVVFSHYSSHTWMVAAADTVEDLVPGSPSYRVLVPERTVENEEIAWDGVTFGQPEVFNVIELTVWRNGGDDYVHVNEWALDSLNPACGQGADLSRLTRHRFSSDIDSKARIGPWDIGADQTEGIEFVDPKPKSFR
jgi:hypothetical protein